MPSLDVCIARARDVPGVRRYPSGSRSEAPGPTGIIGNVTEIDAPAGAATIGGERNYAPVGVEIDESIIGETGSTRMRARGRRRDGIGVASGKQ